MLLSFHLVFFSCDFLELFSRQTIPGLADMVQPQGSEATDPDAANAELYDETVRKVFEKLEIDRKLIEERLVAVVSDGAGTMGAYVDRLNVVREGAQRELIAWVKDAAHCLMQAISTAKGSV